MIIESVGIGKGGKIEPERGVEIMLVDAG